MRRAASLPDMGQAGNGAIFRWLLRVSLPIMASNFIQTVYNLTDAFFLGKLGAAELSAPTIAFSVIFFLVVFGFALAMAGTTLIAQSKGKNDQEKVDFYLGQTTTLLLSIGVFLSVVGVLIAGPLLRLLQTPSDVFAYARDYITIIFAGLPLMFGFFILQAGMQGIGNTITPLWVQAISVGLNVGLDPLLIFGIGFFPAMGVRGAAVATVIARCIGSAIAFWILIRGDRGLRLRLRHMVPKKESVLLMLRIGIPASIGHGVSALGFTVLQGIVNVFDTAVIAAFGVGNRIVSLFNMPAMGISRATTTIVGQSLGAKRPDLTMRSVWIAVAMVLGFLVPAMTFTFFFGRYFVRFFVDDAATIGYGVMLFRIVSPSVVFFGVFMILTGAFQGSGDTKPIMVMNIARLWALRVPLAYLLAIALGIGPTGIWLSMFISNIVVSAFGLYWFRRGTWMHAVRTDEV